MDKNSVQTHNGKSYGFVEQNEKSTNCFGCDLDDNNKCKIRQSWITCIIPFDNKNYILKEVKPDHIHNLKLKGSKMVCEICGEVGF
jgi:hypothetical protein